MNSQTSRAVMLFTLVAILPIISQAQTLKFAWPDGASAKVQIRSQGRRTAKNEKVHTWDMSSDFTMRVQRTANRIVISRDGFSGWKGTFPPSFGGGAERFVDMIPTTIVSTEGAFLGIDGAETARQLMTRSVEQSGGLDPIMRKGFETISTDVALQAIASDHWSLLVGLWQQVDLDPNAYFEIRNVVPVPQLGGGEIEIAGTCEFVKEAPCTPGQGDRQCAHFKAQTGSDPKQVSKIIQSFLEKAGADAPRVSVFEQRLKVEIVVDKQTMLPQQLTVTRHHGFEFNVQGRDSGGSEEFTKSYTFVWILPSDDRKG